MMTQKPVQDRDLPRGPVPGTESWTKWKLVLPFRRSGERSWMCELPRTAELKDGIPPAARTQRSAAPEPHAGPTEERRPPRVIGICAQASASSATRSPRADSRGREGETAPRIGPGPENRLQNWK